MEPIEYLLNGEGNIYRILQGGAMAQNAILSKWFITYNGKNNQLLTFFIIYEKSFYQVRRFVRLSIYKIGVVRPIFESIKKIAGIIID